MFPFIINYFTIKSGLLKSVLEIVEQPREAADNIVDTLHDYVDSTILVSINDCQYVTTVNDTLNTYDLSNVQLYLGGLPVTGSLISGLYPSLTQVNTFSGCIRNVLSNGYYLDMSKALVSANSYYGQSSCTLTNLYTTPSTLITITTTLTTTAGCSAHFTTFRFIWNVKKSF
ncbi:unnamed protein product [Rotaria sordida]|uniref:Uncharacterized protein n=1 Tax=Rotaria sordida TaxID=392033 RepID=A0A815CEK7_9BILA|nr:unnamed protein product [Rotaria sordida]